MKKTIPILVFFAAAAIVLVGVPSISHAQPYGKGLYNLVTYGNLTSLSISTDAIADNLTMPTIIPVEGGTSVTKDNTITVTSTDVKGYMLYIRGINNYMNNLGAHLLPSAHTYTYPSGVSGTGLELDRWGFNTDQGTNFAGITTTDNLIYSTTLPMQSGHDTKVTYGIKLDFGMPAGRYTAQIVYTAVPQTD